jgi:L-threonylcarbamoyladenylate synthase
MKTVKGTDILTAVSFLKDGLPVAIPTETVYGLAANALDESAVLKIFQIKQRPSFDPLIVHVGSKSEVEKYAINIPESAYLLMDRFWPGPLTLVLSKNSVIPDVVTSGLDTVGIRMPSHPLTLELLKNCGFPLAAPSANPFGYVSPTTAQHVLDQLDGLIPYIIDGGPCRVGIESTIVGFENDKCVIYRTGGVTIELLKSVISEITVKDGVTGYPAAPGMLASHYAPGKRMYLGNINKLVSNHPNKKIAVLSYRKPERVFDKNVLVYVLSESGSDEEAAHNLFSFLRIMDNSDAELIIAEKVPDYGLGKAINDRLERAAVK